MRINCFLKSFKNAFPHILRKCFYLVLFLQISLVLGDISPFNIKLSSGSDRPKFGTGIPIYTPIIVSVRSQGQGRESIPKALCSDCQFYLGRRVSSAVLRFQFFSDFVVAAIYLSSPVQLYVLLKKLKWIPYTFPYQFLLPEFGLLLFIQGLIHVLGLFSIYNMPRMLLLTISCLRVLSSFIACSMAALIFYAIPDFLFISSINSSIDQQNKAMDEKAAVIIRKNECDRCLQEMVWAIRSSLDRNDILHTALQQLRSFLGLENAAYWSPSTSSSSLPSSSLELSHECEGRALPVLSMIPLSDSTVKEVLSSSKAVVIEETSDIAKYSCLPTPKGDINPDSESVLAISLKSFSSLNKSSVKKERSKEEGEKGGRRERRGQKEDIGILILILPHKSNRKWPSLLVKMVESVVEELSIALYHASILEESNRKHKLLLQEEHALRLAELEGKSAVKARNNFLAVMKHQLRTPMHSITALSSLLAESDLKEEQFSMVETVAKSSNLLSALVSDILDFWQLEDDNVNLDPQPFELPKLIHDVETLIAPVVKDKGLRFTVTVEPNLPERVVGDGMRLIQVVLNVVENAVQFTQAGFVSLSVFMERMESARDGFVLKAEAGFVFIRFEVRDSGVLIAPQDVPLLFQKFQGDESKASRTGLGLALSKKFIDLMEGHVWITSDEKEKETICTFIVRLKLEKTHEGKMQNVVGKDKEEEEDAPEVNFFALKIMVVDDNMVNRLVTKRLLERMGISTKVVDSGKECLRILQEISEEDKYDVLLLDLMMPEMDGYTVANKIFEDIEENMRPLIVALTANADEHTKDLCLKHGMVGMITKPISLNALRDILGKMLDKNRKP